MLEPGPLVPSTKSKTKPALLSNGVYNFLKPVVTVFFPALGAFYFALAEIWHWDSSTEVVGTIAAFNVLLGVILQLSSHMYDAEADLKYDGDAVINTEADGTKVYSLELNSDADDLENNQVLIFKVRYK